MTSFPRGGRLTDLESTSQRNVSLKAYFDLFMSLFGHKNVFKLFAYMLLFYSFQCSTAAFKIFP